MCLKASYGASTGMPIVTLKSSGSANETQFDRIADYLEWLQCPQFGYPDPGQVTYIKFHKGDWTRLSNDWPFLSGLPQLPPFVQIVVASNLNLSVFPDLPHTVTNVYLERNRIESVPSLQEHHLLEFLNLHDNSIVLLHNPLPPNLRTLVLSYNKLKRISSHIPDTLTEMDLSYNQMWHMPETPQTCRVDMWTHHMWVAEHDPHRAPTVQTIPQGEQQGHREQQGLWRRQGLRRRQGHRVADNNVIYHNAQNVHATSVQKSVSESVEAVLQKTKGLVLSPQYIKEVERLWKYRLPVVGLHIIQPVKIISKKVPPIRAWCQSRNVHSVHGVTFGFMLQHVWALIQTNPHKKELQRILKQELEASRGVCFTGRFSRLINTLTGFVDGIGVSIGESDQMQANIATAVRVGRQEKKTTEEIRAHVVSILDEFGVHDATMRQAWLGAIDDEDEPEGNRF